ncbi:MAG: hypothetical protein Q4C95_09145 [Planctomycetia bacterium]|nr:hypothetical protein [Planctomycetia bacterium]
MSFNFTAAIRNVCNDICLRVPDLTHIDMTRVGISFCQTRQNEKYGVFASLTPLKFKDGSSFNRKKTFYWMIPDVYGENKQKILYLLSFYMPRFMNLSLIDKFDTIIHELYHINQDFNGDIRRFQGRCFAHGSSRKKYDHIVQQYVKEWLEKDPPPEIWHFLKMDFKELETKYQGVFGTKFQLPKMKRLTEYELQKYQQNKTS